MNKKFKKMVQEYLERMPANAGPKSPLTVGGNPWHGDSKSTTQSETGKFKTWTTKGSQVPIEYTTEIKFNKLVVLRHICKVHPFDKDKVYEEAMTFVNKELEKPQAPKPIATERNDAAIMDIASSQPSHPQLNISVPVPSARAFVAKDLEKPQDTKSVASEQNSTSMDTSSSQPSVPQLNLSVVEPSRAPNSLSNTMPRQENPCRAPVSILTSLCLQTPPLAHLPMR